MYPTPIQGDHQLLGRSS